VTTSQEIDAEAMVERHRPLARHLAGRYRASSEPFDDLVQTAYVGLVKAVHRYDPERGIAFSSFAQPTILGELRHHFRDRTWTVRVPRRLQEISLALDRATPELTAELGRRPSAAELAERVRATVEEVVDALEMAHAYQPDSLDEGEPWTGSALDAGFERVEQRALLRDLLSVLEPEARTIVLLRFHEELSQTEIAARLGCSQMHVSRVLRRSMARLREAADGGA